MFGISKQTILADSDVIRSVGMGQAADPREKPMGTPN